MSASDTMHRGIWTTQPNVALITFKAVTVTTGNPTVSSDQDGLVSTFTRDSAGVYTLTFTDTWGEFLGANALHAAITTPTYVRQFTCIPDSQFMAKVFTITWYETETIGTSSADATLVVGDMPGTIYWQFWMKDRYPQAK